MVWFKSFPYTIQENITVHCQVIYHGEVLANGRYFCTYIDTSIWYVTPRDGIIETGIPTRTVIQGKKSEKKIRSITEPPWFLKTIKEE